jgi:hypothetical protein
MPESKGAITPFQLDARRIMSMSEPTAGRFEVVEEQGPPRGDLYKLEQRTYYHVIDRNSQKTIMTFESLMEASLSTDTGTWDDYYFSGVREVSIAPNEQSVIVSYHDGLVERVPLPQYGPWGGVCGS